MGAETAQPKPQEEMSSRIESARNTRTFVKFKELLDLAEDFGIVIIRIPKPVFDQDPIRYFEGLSPKIKEKLDQIPDGVLRRPRERSLKPAQLRSMIERYYGLDGNPPASSYKELFDGLTASRNYQLVTQALGRCRHYLRSMSSDVSAESNTTVPTSNPDWSKLGDLSKHYN